MSTFLSDEDMKGKKVTYFYCHGLGKTNLKFKDALVDSNIISGLDLKRSKEDDLKKIVNFSIIRYK